MQVKDHIGGISPRILLGPPSIWMGESNHKKLLHFLARPIIGPSSLTETIPWYQHRPRVKSSKWYFFSENLLLEPTKKSYYFCVCPFLRWQETFFCPPLPKIISYALLHEFLSTKLLPLVSVSRIHCYYWK